MKFHITNLYNFNAGDELVAKQHHFADAGRELGFTEMGIFSYPVKTDTSNELSKRLDGIIASLEPNDFVFVQLPTTNGIQYEQLLLNKIKAYKNTKVAFILHDTKVLHTADKELQAKYISLYKQADVIIAPSACEFNLFVKNDITNLLFYDHLCAINHLNGNFSTADPSVCQSDLFFKKLFLDCIDKVFSPQKNILVTSIPVTEDEIHIGFGLHDKTGNYSVWVGVTMQSIIEHTNSKVCFHILHDETLTTENRNKLIQVAATGGHRVLFHHLDNSVFAGVEKLMSIYTIGAMFRILLPEVLLDLDKIIYLDADLFVNRDIKELWDTDISGYSMAAVPDAPVVSGIALAHVVKRNEVPANRYFNSGVLFMNLERIRQTSNMKIEVLNFLECTQEDSLPDQDALNYIYSQDTLLLDASWNYFVNTARRNSEFKVENKIYHYAGTRCVLYYLSAIDILYFETMNRTPWGFKDCRVIIDNTLERMTDRVRHLEKAAAQLCQNKKKIYYGSETFAMRNLFSMFPLQPADYRIVPSDETYSHGILPYRDISALANEEKDSFIVFVLPEADNGKSIENLKNMGLVFEKDYFVIPRLLPSLKGGYL